MLVQGRSERRNITADCLRARSGFPNLRGEVMKEKLDEVEAFVFERMAKTKLPGLSAAAVQGEQVVWEKGFRVSFVTWKTPSPLHLTPCAGSAPSRSYSPW